MMPASIATLPRTKAGTPISHTVAYSDEGVTVRPDPLLNDALAFFPATPLAGEPILNRPDASRQRESVLRGLCQVCTQPLDTPRWICDLRIMPGRALRIDDAHQPLLVDSWTCSECLRWSLTGCPRLAKLLDLRIYECDEWLTVPTPERPRHLDGWPWGPIGYVQVAPMPGSRKLARVEFMEATR